MVFSFIILLFFFFYFSTFFLFSFGPPFLIWIVIFLFPFSILLLSLCSFLFCSFFFVFKLIKKKDEKVQKCNDVTFQFLKKNRVLFITSTISYKITKFSRFPPHLLHLLSCSFLSGLSIWSSDCIRRTSFLAFKRSAENDKKYAMYPNTAIHSAIARSSLDSVDFFLMKYPKT